MTMSNDRDDDPQPSRLGGVLGASFGAYQGLRAGIAINDWMTPDIPPMPGDLPAAFPEDAAYNHLTPLGAAPFALGVPMVAALGGWAGWRLGRRNIDKSALLLMTAAGAGTTLAVHAAGSGHGHSHAQAHAHDPTPLSQDDQGSTDSLQWQQTL